MKAVARFLARAVGVAFLVAAFLQWITFDYPDVNPFRLGGIFVPGVLSQVVNWLFVCLLATIGWGLFTLGKFKFKSSRDDQRRPS